MSCQRLGGQVYPFDKIVKRVDLTSFFIASLMDSDT
jgi:hypothetical protein